MASKALKKASKKPRVKATRKTGSKKLPLKALKTTSEAKARSHITTDHEVIREWAESRGAQPARVKGTGRGGDVGIIRLDFPGYSGQKLEPITWEEWFEKFDENNLALLYQDQTAGGDRSNFNKIISAETAQEFEGKKAA